jgi:Family of unknown function (DUF5716)
MEIEAFDDIDAVDDEIRGIVARNCPHLLAKLPPEGEWERVKNNGEIYFRGLSGTISRQSAPETAEHLVYNRLREDGWIMEVANRRALEVYMPREAHALLSSLITLKEELRVDISAEASLIDSGIIAAYQDPACKVMNIASARRQAVQLRRSIDGVLTSLHRIEDRIVIAW